MIILAVTQLKIFEKEVMKIKNVIKRISAITMAFTLINTGSNISKSIIPSFASPLIANAEFNSYNGTVKTHGGNLNVRSGPGTNYRAIRSLSNGSRVTIYEENNGWGRISSSQEWVSLSYIIPDTTSIPTQDYTTSNDVTQIFSDVSSGQWYVDAIQYVYDQGLMSGKIKPTQSSKGYFDISGTITKAEFATVLYNLAGKPPIDYYGFFSDVPDDQWFTKPALFSFYYGIVRFDSTLNNSFYDLNERLTREKVAMMLYEYVKAFSDYNTSKNIDASDGYIDSNNISENAKEAMDWAVTQNIIKGKGNPNDTKVKLSRNVQSENTQNLG